MRSKRDENSNIFDTLFMRLTSRGLMPVEIVRLIRDVCNIIGDGGYVTVESVNQDLKRLGWSERSMDIISFELIVFLIENEYDCEVETHTLH